MSALNGIASLTSTGLRARDAELTLGDLTLVLGPVGSGKSSVLDAIRFVALGHVPHIGKSEAATASLMRGDTLAVSAFTSSGRISRSLTRTVERGKPVMRSQAEASWLPQDTALSEHDAAITRLFGASAVDAAEHLDLRELLSCSPAERARRISALLDASGLTPDAAALRFRALLTHRLQEQCPADVTQIGDGTLGGLAPDIRPLVAPFADRVETRLRGGGIAAAEGAARDEAKAATASGKAARAARGELEDRLHALPTMTETTESLRTRLEVAVAARAASIRSTEIATQRASARADAVATLAAVAPTVTQAEADYTVAHEALGLLPDLRASLAAIVDPAAPEPRVSAVLAEPPEIARMNSQAASCAANATGILVPVVTSTAPQERELARLHTALHNATASELVAALALAEGVRESLLGRADMDATAQQCEELVAILRAYAPDVAGIRAQVATAEETLATERSNAAAAATLRDEAMAEIARLRAVEVELRNDAARLSNSWIASVNANTAETERGNRERLEAHNATMSANNAARDKITAQMEALVAEAQRTERALDAAKATLARAEAVIAGIDSTPVIATACATDEEIARIRGLLESAEARDALRTEMSRILAAITASEAERDVWAAAVYACGIVRQEDLALRAQGIESRMAQFLTAASRPETPYLRASKSATDFGWVRDGREITIEAMSGGEYTMFAAALAAAVISLRAPGVKILMIEENEVGLGEPFQGLLAGCAAISAAHGIQCIVASNLPHSDVPAGWSVVSLASWGELTMGPRPAAVPVAVTATASA